ncbi:GIY-YIG nuclease family protein [Clostridium sp. UBA5988]|uniref:GIY-YIG nuclease family protein n=1 Tax=Clostridium sp. UBA5988 TaxID=1946369 RepID=UPI003216E4E9
METEERREYKKRWYLKNKDTEEFKQRQKENKKLYREKHKNTEEYKKKNREASKKAREQNRDYYMEYSKTYYKNNKEKWDIYNNKNSFICVYRFVSKKDGIILRIGSTANIKARLQNYMSNGINGVRLKEWFEDYDLDRIEYILCSDRETAYMVEYNLIKRFNPILNEKEVLHFEDWDEDVEDLWQTWSGLDYYKCKYKAMCNEDL